MLRGAGATGMGVGRDRSLQGASGGLRGCQHRGREVCARAGTEQTPPHTHTFLDFPVQQGGTQTDRGVGQAPLRKAGVLIAVMEGSCGVASCTCWLDLPLHGWHWG